MSKGTKQIRAGRVERFIQEMEIQVQMAEQSMERYRGMGKDFAFMLPFLEGEIYGLNTAIREAKKIIGPESGE